MKKLFKFIFKLILFVIILVALIVGGVIYAISDKTDESDVTKLDTTATVDSTLSSTLSKSLDNLGTNYSMDVILDETTLNNLLYAVAKKINSNYNPAKENASASEKYIFSFEVPSDIPVVGGKAMGVKNLYAKVNTETEEVSINLTADVDQKLNTRIHFTFKVVTSADAYDLIITEIKFGKINLMGSLAVTAIESADLVSMINGYLKNYPFTFVLNDGKYSLNCKKSDFNAFVKKYLGGDSASEGDMKTEFVNLLLDPEKDMIKLGMFANGFGVKINLEGLKVDASKTTVDESVKEGFDTNKFIEAQAQALIINGIYSTGDKFLSISEADMTKLIYQNMLKDSEIKFETELMAGVNFKFALEGISFDIDDEAKHLLINIILNVNGLKTTAVLTGDIEQAQVVNQEVLIALDKNKLQLGNDFFIDSAFLTDILSENFKTSDIMKFENGKLVFSADVFNTMLETAMEGKSTPLQVKGIGFVKDNLRVYVEYSDQSLADQISKVTDSLKGALETGITLDTSKFSPEEVEKVAEVQEKLDEIKNKEISEITAEDTDALMATVGEMSSEAQEEFFNSVTESVDPAELQALYDLMFANK